MTTQKKGLIHANEQEKKSVQELLKLRKEHEENAGGKAHDFQEALQEEFHKVWDDTIKPALEQLKDTTDDLLKQFTDFEDDFRGYLRDREPDVDIVLLKEIYGDSIGHKSDDKKNSELIEDSDL